MNFFQYFIIKPVRGFYGSLGWKNLNNGTKGKKIEQNRKFCQKYKIGTIIRWKPFHYHSKLCFNLLLKP